MNILQYVEMHIHADSKGKVAAVLHRGWAWININNGKGSSSWVRQQSENTQASGLFTPDP